MVSKSRTLRHVDRKPCTGCKKDLAREFYSASKHTSDGLQVRCKECQRDYRARNADAIRARKAKRYEENVDIERARNAERYKANSGQRKAQAAKYKRENAERVKQAAAAFRKANRDSIRAKDLSYRQAHAEERKRWQAEYSKNNAERYRLNARAWAARNPHKVRALRIGKRASKFNTGRGDDRPIVAFCQWLLSADSIACYWCQETTEAAGRQVDHIIPLQKGGPHSVGNLCVSCASCNSRKGSKLPEEFAGQAELRLA